MTSREYRNKVSLNYRDTAVHLDPPKRNEVDFFILKGHIMTTLLPLDGNHTPLPALRLKNNGAHSINATDTAARNSIVFDADTQIVSVYASGPVFIRFGDSTVTASSADHYFPEGLYYDFSIGGGAVAHASHISVIRANYDCEVFVSEKC